jgi:hypothetical protein
MDQVLGPESLQAHMERWEREKRQMLGLGVAVLTLCVGLALFASGWGRRPKVVEAESFVMRDHEGKIRARLVTDGDGSTVLTFLDSLGQNQVQLRSTGDRTSGFYLYDHGRVRIGLTAAPVGNATINLFDNEGERSTEVYMKPDGASGVTFRDGSGAIHLSTKHDDPEALRVVDGSGREVGRAEVAAAEHDRSTRTGATATPPHPARTSEQGPAPAEHGREVVPRPARRFAPVSQRCGATPRGLVLPVFASGTSLTVGTVSEALAAASCLADSVSQPESVRGTRMAAARV